MQVCRFMENGRAITILGARRVGKTTLVKTLLERFRDRRVPYLKCDPQPVQRGAPQVFAPLGLRDIPFYLFVY